MNVYKFGYLSWNMASWRLNGLKVYGFTYNVDNFQFYIF